MRSARRQLGTETLAVGEMLEVESKIDGKPLAFRPCVVGPAAQRYVVVAIVGLEFHKQSVASDFAMGYGYTPNEEAAGTAADAWEGK